MQVNGGLTPGEKARNKAFWESAGRQANEAAIAMQNLATTYGNPNTGVSKRYPSAQRISTDATPLSTQPFKFRLASPSTSSEDSDNYGPPYVNKMKKDSKKSQPSQLLVGSSDSSGGSYGARRRNKSKKGRPAPLSREDTDDVLDVPGDGTDDVVIIVEKSAKRR
jgi:hypothetical protein